NMLITCLLLRMNRNDAFSSLRIGGYNNFLRFRLTDDGFDMYVVGLKHVPKRDDWIAHKDHDKNKPDPEISVFVPKSDLEPHTIEKASVRMEPKPAAGTA